MASDLQPHGGPGSTYDNFGLKSSGTTVAISGVGANLNWGILRVKRVIGPYTALSLSGTPIGQYSFSNAKVVELVSVVSTASSGTISVSAETNYALSTEQYGLAASLGTLAAAIPIDITPTAVVGTSGLGTLTNTTASIVSVAGVGATGSAGEASFAGAITIGGQFATSGLGTLTPTTAQVISISGNTATGTLGDITASAVVIAELSSLVGTTGLGSLTVTIPAAQRSAVSDLSLSGTPGFVYTFVDAQAATVSIDSPVMTGEVATFDGLSTTYGVDGVGSAGSAGAAGVSSGITVAITAVVATGDSEGIILPVTVVPVGTSASGFVGGVSVQTDAGTGIDLASDALTSGLGTLLPSAEVIQAITGVTGTASNGTPVVPGSSIGVPIDGVGASSGIGDLSAPFLPTSVIITGVLGQMGLGALGLTDVASRVVNATASTDVPNNYEVDTASGFRVYPGDLIRDGQTGHWVRKRSFDPRHPQERLTASVDIQRGAQRVEQTDKFIGTDVPAVTAGDL